MDTKNNEFENTEIDNIIILTDEDGKDEHFEFLDLIEYENEEFVVLLPIDEGSDEVVILKVEQNQIGDEETYIGVEDSKILDAVFCVFKDEFQDEFDFID